LALGVLQNPYLSQYLDVYLVGSETLDSTSVHLQMGEEPLAIHGADQKNNVWMADYRMAEPGGIVSLTGCAADAAGNDTCVTSTFSSSMIDASLGGTVFSADGRMSVNIDRGALAHDTHIVILPCQDAAETCGPASITAADVGALTLLAADGTIPAGYHIGSSCEFGAGVASAEFHYTDADLGAAGRPDQLYIEEDGIGPLMSNVDLQRTTIRAEISRFGTFRLAKGRPGMSKVNDPAFLLTYPSVPNPCARSMNIRFEVEAQQRITATIYAVTGRPVKCILDESVPPGVHQVSWDGTESSGQSVAGGVYFLRIQTEHSGSTSKIALVK
jgi:hypothetical protein